VTLLRVRCLACGGGKFEVKHGCGFAEVVCRGCGASACNAEAVDRKRRKMAEAGIVNLQVGERKAEQEGWGEDGDFTWRGAHC
jgi:hypothetical protein